LDHQRLDIISLLLIDIKPLTTPGRTQAASTMFSAKQLTTQHTARQDVLYFITRPRHYQRAGTVLHHITLWICLSVRPSTIGSDLVQVKPKMFLVFFLNIHCDVNRASVKVSSQQSDLPLEINIY